MGAEWYYASGKKPVGPVTEEELASVISGDPQPEELLVWREDFSQWKRVRDIDELVRYTNRRQPPPIPPQIAAPKVVPPLSQKVVPPLSQFAKQRDVEKSASWKKKSYNLVALHWRGDLPLWVSYWIIAFFLNICLVIVVAIIAAGLAPQSGYNPLSVFVTLSFIWLFVIAATIWQLVGVWRSANRYMTEKAAQNKSAVWGGVAKFAVIIGILRSLVEVAQSGYPQIDAAARMAFMNDPRIPNYSLRIMRNGREIEVAGGFKYGLDDDLQRLLAAAPMVRTVHLNSVGGRIGEAVKVYRRIKDNNLDTYTSTGCYSACTIAFMGGKERWLGPNANLGFHAPAFPGLTTDELAGEKEQQRKIMAAAGVPSAFVSHALSTPNNTMWYPTPTELFQSNVITGVANNHQFAASGFGASITREEFEQKFKHVSLFQALQKSNPKVYDAFIREFQTGYVAGESEGDLIDHLRAKLLPVIRADIPLASSDTVVNLGYLYFRQLTALAAKDKRLCFAYLFSGNDGSLTQYIPQNLVDEELKLNEQVLVTAQPRVPNASLSKELWSKVVANLAARFGNKVSLITQKTISPSDQADYCDLGLALYQETLRLPSDQAATILRDMFRR